MDEAAKIAWGNEMRRQFSPAGVSLEDGSINQDFFKPKKIIIQLTEAKRWGEQEKAALLKVNYIFFFNCVIQQRSSPSSWGCITCAGY
jgi:hypothetical protein